MNPHIDHEIGALIRKAGSEVTLSPSARARMRVAVHAYAEERPVGAGWWSASRYRMACAVAWRTRLPMAVFASMVLLLSASGVAYAARGSLPGSPLYPLMVGVLEPVQTLFTTSPAEQASWRMTLAERRIEEAAVLAEHGALATSTAETLQRAFVVQVGAAHAALEKEDAKDPVTASISRTNFAARLDAYGSVLAMASAKDAPGANDQLRESIQSSVGTLIPAAGASSSSTKQRTQEPRRADALQETARFQHAAGAALNSAAHALSVASSTLDTAVASQLQARFKSAADSAQKGHAFLEQRDAEQAIDAFERTLQETARLNVLTRAASVLNINVFEASSTTEDEDASRTRSGSDASHATSTKRGR